MATKARKTVLVVDDDASIRRAMRRLLSSFDYNVLLFENAETFLKHAPLPEKACLLLDVFLPGMSGIELYSRMEASGRTMPTIFMTARDDESTRSLFSGIAATTILFKPFEEHVLLEAIRWAMAEKKSPAPSEEVFSATEMPSNKKTNRRFAGSGQKKTE